MNPGSIVRCRNRDWVLLPNQDPNLLLLRPLTGATDEVVAVHKGLTDLLGYSFPEERARSAKFLPPTPDDLSNVAGAHLLWQAARLTLREGATPLRSLDAQGEALRAELGAWLARAYGLTRDELRYILDPADVHGPDFPGETFRVLKEKETTEFGEYRTRRLVLEAWDRLR